MGKDVHTVPFSLEDLCQKPEQLRLIVDYSHTPALDHTLPPT